MIVAPAGYGKTTLMAEWAQTNEDTFWYNLDIYDNDPIGWIANLIHGLQNSWADFGRMTEALLTRRAHFQSDQFLESLASSFIRELEEVVDSRGLLMVLDDYHLIGDTEEVHRFIDHLLPNLPPSIHLAIASREAFPFSIQPLRQEKLIVEIDETELRFRPHEIYQLFRNHPLTPGEIRSLAAQVEGWPIGLHLIQQALGGREEFGLPSFKDSLPELTSGVYHYLAEEIFARQPAQLQEFLLQSALLDHFTAEDCDAIFERDDSHKFLTELKSRNLFINQLSRNPDTFRYHHLFRDYLGEKLNHEGNPESVQGWHKKAAHYYSNKHEWGEAFDHAQKTREEALAAETFAKALSPLRMAGKLDTLQKWLDQQNRAAFNVYPALYTCQGYIWSDQGQHQQAEIAFKKAIEIAKAQDDSGSLTKAWSGLGMTLHQKGALDEARHAWEEAVSSAQDVSIHAQCSAHVGLAAVHYYAGQNHAALEEFLKALELAYELNKQAQALVMNNIGTVMIFMGRFPEALHWLGKSLQIREEFGLKPGIAKCLSDMGIVHAWLGNLEEARGYLERAVSLVEETHHLIWLSIVLGNLGYLAYVEGNYDQAEKLFQRAIQIKGALNDTDALTFILTQQSALRRAQGDLESAWENAKSAQELSETTSGPNDILQARLELALVMLSKKDLVQARKYLEEVIAGYRQPTSNYYGLARGLWYLSQAQQMAGEDGLETLAEALSLIERWNYRFLLKGLARETPETLMAAIAADLYPTLITQVINDLGDEIVPALRDSLLRDELAVRLRVIHLLAHLGTEGVWEPLVAAARAPETEVRKAARVALDQLKAAPPAPLRVTTLGRFTLQRGRREIQDAEWRNRKALALFKFLLLTPGHLVHREKIIDRLWPEVDPEASRRYLNQAVFVLRNVLEPYLPARYPSRYLYTEGETYRLRLPEGSYVEDLDFAGKVAQAKEAGWRGELALSSSLYLQAMDLYRGEYLPEDQYVDWCMKRREELQEMAVSALEEISQYQFDSGEVELAGETAERLLAMDSFNQRGYILLMQSLLALGRQDGVLRTYQRYLERYCKEFEVPPSAEIQEIYRLAKQQS